VVDGPDLIVVPALQIRRANNRPPFLFALDTDTVRQIADVSPVRWKEATELVECLDRNRPGCRDHIVMAFSSQVGFAASRGCRDTAQSSIPGRLVIRRPAAHEPKRAWIVEGQEAVTRAKGGARCIVVIAFVADVPSLDADRSMIRNRGAGGAWTDRRAPARGN
jgi:hypothetical protein